jgi:hypothetical protein
MKWPGGRFKVEDAAPLDDPHVPPGIAAVNRRPYAFVTASAPHLLLSVRSSYGAV